MSNIHRSLGQFDSCFNELKYWISSKRLPISLKTQTMTRLLTLHVEVGGVAGEGEAGRGVGGEAGVEAGVLGEDAAQEQRRADLEAARGGGDGGGVVLPGIEETGGARLTVQPRLPARHRRHVRRLHAEVEGVVLPSRPAPCNMSTRHIITSSLTLFNLRDSCKATEIIVQPTG